MAGAGGVIAVLKFGDTWRLDVWMKRIDSDATMRKEDTYNECTDARGACGMREPGRRRCFWCGR